jgi:iron complex transport system permease protein
MLNYLRARAVILFSVVLIALIMTAVIALLSGAAANDSVIIWNIRAPRVVTAILVGGGLALAGVLLQGSLRNPLADPALVGVSAGAALGTVVGAAIGVGYNTVVAALFALIGGLVAVFIVVWVARTHGRIEVVTVLLGGVAVTAFASAAVAIIISLSGLAGSRPVSFWATGSFALSNWNGVWSIAPAVAVGAVIAFWIAPALNVLSLGDDAAFASGIEVKSTRMWALIAAVLLTGAGVAVVGVIAFIGLLVPHAVRLLIGPSHRGLMAVSVVAGAFVVVAADTIARLVVSPAELPVGAITAIVGAPLFLVIVARTRSRQGGWA